MRSFIFFLILSARTWAAPVVTFGSPDVNPNGFPFNPSINGVPNMRYQAVYDASIFSAQGLVAPGLLSMLNFDAINTTFSATISNIQIFASTTSATPAAMDLTFDNNLGPDATLVYSGALTLSSAGGDFDVSILLQNTFQYNPALGNLLLDIRNFSGEVTSPFANIAAADTTTARLFSSAFSPTGVQAGDDALSTRFTFGPLPAAPELNARSWAAPLCFCLVLLALRSRRQPLDEGARV